MHTNEFWEAKYSRGDDGGYSRIEMPNLSNPLLQCALEYFGDVNGKIVIDLGCGSGASSLFFAYHNANVISIDTSEVAINNLSMYCAENDINNITPVCLNAQEITKLGKVDFVFRKMILHHIEPFEEFVVILRDAIKPGSKAFFLENNAHSNLIMWFRENVVGKVWVPKYGDPDESPLSAGEISIIRKYFDVEVEFPELFFFRLIPMYLFRGHISRPFQILDNLFYRINWFRKYSYKQYLYLR